MVDAHVFFIEFSVSTRPAGSRPPIVVREYGLAQTSLSWSNRGGRKVMSLDHWELLLRGANSEAVVIQIVRDYLAQLAPDDYERLPFDCRPRVATGADVYQWAVHLTRCELK